MSLVGLQDAIVASIGTKLAASFRTVQEHGGRYDEAEIRRIASMQPGCFVSVLGGDVARHGGSKGVCAADVVAVIITAGSSTTNRGRACAALAEAVANLAVNNVWTYSEAKAPEGIRARNFYSGTLDRMGVAMWIVRWMQQTDFADVVDLDALDQFHEFHGKFDMNPADSVIDIEALVYLHESQLLRSVGFMYVSVKDATTISSPDTYQKAAGTTVLEYSSADVTMPQSNRLQYAGPPKPAKVKASATIDAGPLDLGFTDATVTLALAVNGVVDESTAMPAFVERYKKETIDINATLDLNDGDYVEVWIKSSETTDIYLETMTVTAMAV